MDQILKEFSPELNPIIIKCQAADRLPIDAILELQGKLKTLSNKNRDKLIRSIFKLGYIAPMFIWQNDGDNKLCDGHQRLKTLIYLRQKGWNIPMLPVAYVEAESEEDAKRKILGITSSFGEFDVAELTDWLNDFDDDFFRFTDEEINIDVNTNSEETTGDDDIPEIVKPVTKLGDLWELGEHRLLCGDSTNSETVSILMNGQKADMVFTDPPYNIDFKPQRGTHGKIKNDNMSDSNFEYFLNEIFSRCKEVLNPDTYLISFMGWSTIQNFRKTLIDKFEIKSMPIWKKNNFGIGYYTRPQYEPMFLCLNGNPVKPLKAPSDVFEFDKVYKTIHSCEKPISMLIGISDYFNRNGLFYEPFAGSGSMIMACEKTNRKCYGLELDPHYCDVIVNRYKTWCENNNRTPIIKLNGEVHND